MHLHLYSSLLSYSKYVQHKHLKWDTVTFSQFILKLTVLHDRCMYQNCSTVCAHHRVIHLSFCHARQSFLKTQIWTAGRPVKYINVYLLLEAILLAFTQNNIQHRPTKKKTKNYCFWVKNIHNFVNNGLDQFFFFIFDFFILLDNTNTYF